MNNSNTVVTSNLKTQSPSQINETKQLTQTDKKCNELFKHFLVGFTFGAGAGVFYGTVLTLLSICTGTVVIPLVCGIFVTPLLIVTGGLIGGTIGASVYFIEKTANKIEKSITEYLNKKNTTETPDLKNNPFKNNFQTIKNTINGTQLKVKNFLENFQTRFLIGYRFL